MVDLFNKKFLAIIYISLLNNAITLPNPGMRIVISAITGFLCFTYSAFKAYT